MKHGHGLLLQAWFQINQKIAATHKVHAGKRRVCDQVLTGEDHLFPHGLDHPVAAILSGKEAPEPFR